jgi:hypothetical protein
MGLALFLGIAKTKECPLQVGGYFELFSLYPNYQNLITENVCLWRTKMIL